MSTTTSSNTKIILVIIVLLVGAVSLYLVTRSSNTTTKTTSTTGTATTTPTTTTNTTAVANEFGVATTSTPQTWLQIFTGYDCSGNDIGSTNSQLSAQQISGAKGIVLNQYGTWYAKSSSSNGFYTDGATQNTWQYYSSYAIPAASNLFVGWVTSTYFITSAAGFALNSTPGNIYSISVAPTAAGFQAALRAVGTGAFVFNTTTSRVCFYSTI